MGSAASHLARVLRDLSGTDAFSPKQEAALEAALGETIDDDEPIGLLVEALRTMVRRATSAERDRDRLQNELHRIRTKQRSHGEYLPALSTEGVIPTALSPRHDGGEPLKGEPPTNKDEATMSAVEQAERLVYQAHHGNRDAAHEAAVTRLRAATEDRSEDAIAWLDACARMRVRTVELCAIVEPLMGDAAWSDEVRWAAMEAIRSIAYGTERAAESAAMLQTQLDHVAKVNLDVARQVLIGIIVLSPLAGLRCLGARLDTWEPSALKGAIRAATRVLFKKFPRERERSIEGPVVPERQAAFDARHAIEQVRELHCNVVRSIPKWRALGRDAEFAFANLLELWVLTAPREEYDVVADMLVETYRSGTDVVRAGAVSATRLWMLDDWDAFGPIIRAMRSGDSPLQFAITMPLGPDLR